MADVRSEQLNRPRKRRADTPLLVITLVLVFFGLLMMYSASFANSYYMYGDSFRFIKKQVIFAVLGVGAMLLMSHINYHILRTFAWPLYGVSVLLLGVTLFMDPINNAKRWIIIGGFTFQPSEIAKFAVILLFAHLFSARPSLMKKLPYGYILPLGALGLIALIMLNQPHLSGTILICAVGAVLMFVAGSKLKWFLLSGAVVVPLGLAFIFMTDRMSYAMSRIQMWLDPFEDRTGAGHQTIQSLLAIGSGGLFGLGLGNSRQKHLYVPEPQNDFIFSIICEEMGFIGALLVIGLFVAFVQRGFAIAMHAKDKFGALLAIGVTVQVGLQAMLNIAVVTNTIPNTGISLPFFSSGGTSLAMLLWEVGVLLSVSRYSATKKV